MEKTSSREEGLWVFFLDFPFPRKSKHEKAEQMINLKAITGANGFPCSPCSRSPPPQLHPLLCYKCTRPGSSDLLGGGGSIPWPARSVLRTSTISI